MLTRRGGVDEAEKESTAWEENRIATKATARATRGNDVEEKDVISQQADTDPIGEI